MPGAPERVGAVAGRLIPPKTQRGQARHRRAWPGYVALRSSYYRCIGYVTDTVAETSMFSGLSGGGITEASPAPEVSALSR